MGKGGGGERSTKPPHAKPRTGSQSAVRWTFDTARPKPTAFSRAAPTARSTANRTAGRDSVNLLIQRKTSSPKGAFCSRRGRLGHAARAAASRPRGNRPRTNAASSLSLERSNGTGWSRGEPTGAPPPSRVPPDTREDFRGCRGPAAGTRGAGGARQRSANDGSALIPRHLRGERGEREKPSGSAPYPPASWSPCGGPASPRRSCLSPRSSRYRRSRPAGAGAGPRWEPARRRTLT